MCRWRLPICIPTKWPNPTGAHPHWHRLTEELRWTIVRARSGDSEALNVLPLGVRCWKGVLAESSVDGQVLLHAHAPTRGAPVDPISVSDLLLRVGVTDGRDSWVLNSGALHRVWGFCTLLAAEEIELRALVHV